MGSPGNQNPLSPYENYRDCSLGICSIYCPQFCYLIFPPPPPSDDSSSTSTTFSPLIIAVIGLLATAFLLVSYYTIVTKFCKRRRRRRNNEAHQHRRDSTEIEENRDEWTVGPAGGMAESLIEKITVCEYKKGEGLIEGTECAVCLSEFREEESLRLLPKCSHAFHLPCIDTWLKSQSNCPLCRANVAVSACEVSRPEDLVLEVVEDQEMEHTVVISGGDEEEGRDDEESSSDREGVQQVRRSVSLDTFPFPSTGRQLLVSDILKFEEIDEYVRVEIDQLWRGIGSSEGDGDRGKDGKLLRSPVAMKRSISTGRFTGQVAG